MFDLDIVSDTLDPKWTNPEDVSNPVRHALRQLLGFKFQLL